jgi:hypothetical protein
MCSGRVAVPAPLVTPVVFQFWFFRRRLKLFLLQPILFFLAHHGLVDRYGIAVSQMTTDMLHLS